MKKEITISKKDFMDKAAQAMHGGMFSKVLKRKNPELMIILMPMMSCIMADITGELFDKEDCENGRE